MFLTRLARRARGGSGRARSERGQTLVEYALIIAVVSLGAVAALTFLRDEIVGVFTDSGSALSEAGSAGGSGTTPPPPPAPLVPAPGTVTINPNTEQDLDVNFTANTSGWSNTPTSYSFLWQQTAEGTNCSGAFSTYETDNPGGGGTSATSNLDDGNDNNRCYRVLVNATNGSGTSTTSATSTTVLVTQDFDDLSVSISPSTPQVDGASLTATASTADPTNTIATTYTFQWWRSARAEGENDCTGGAFNWQTFDALVTVANVATASQASPAKPTTSGTSQDYCYSVVASGDNAATNAEQGQSNNTVFVEGDG